MSISQEQLNKALAADKAFRNMPLRTVKGWFGIPVHQIRLNGQWWNLPPGEYERFRKLQQDWKSGSSNPNLSPEGQFYQSVAREYNRLEGMALEDSNYSTVLVRNYPGLRAAITTVDEENIFIDAGNKMLNMLNAEPQSYDSSAVDDWAKACCAGIMVLSTLKIQATLLRLQPKVTRLDTSNIYPFTRTSTASALAALKGLRIPAVCYPISEIYTRVIQVGGAEKLNSIDSQYLVPYCHGITQATFEDEIDKLDSLSKAGLFANYINKPLVPISEAWISKPHIVPYYSDYAQAMCEMLPIALNAGGVAVSDEEYKTDVDCYYNQNLGMPELFSAGPIFREVSGGASAVFTICDSPSADKLGMLYFADKSSTTYTEVPNTVTRFDYIKNVSVARTAIMRGIFAHQDNFMQYHTIKGDESSWSRRFANFIFSKILKPNMPVISLSRLLPSMTPALSKPGIKIANASQSKYGSGL